ncbi:hypothetical protein [Deinococcus sp.]|uniref:hypothetical protein n=1 Tax=Deinococcus sp. TaxID=47478 RepID=UPI003C7C858E
MTDTVQELRAIFPALIPFPPLLADFVAWAEQFERGQLGWFEFEAQRLDDDWIENGAALADQFALFIRLPDGSMVGFWKPDGDAGALPVVLLGSEGAQEVLGSTLEEFLWNWARGELGEAYDLMPDDQAGAEASDEQPADARPALAAWLQEKSVRVQVKQVPDLKAFFADWQEKQIE